MKETYFAGTYWACRKESAEQSSRRAEAFFRHLSSCDSIYARWFEQAGSLKKALQLQFEPTFEAFMRFFKKKAYQNGPDGFSFSAWTGHEEDGHGGMMSLTCGSCSNFYSNACLLYLPSAGSEEERVLTVSVLAEVLRAMVLAWEPDWCVVTSAALRDTLSENGHAGTFVGWLTYVSRSRGAVPPLPEPVRVQPVEDKGTLVLLSPERITASNPEHVALARRVQDALFAEGLLNPVVSGRPAT
ncbi:immunity 52 family protein [Archangium lansingense]|uniref:Immunity 52 family protein n=1 Tax=Archangium lansingense TaxID=2995310 RepID=A0ABT4A374_9BACT|nr:immunity 52 family protein [Archangium lansinium]MCY1075429.1 immunity 52 family protein [Archangium lansinium]